MATDEEDRLTLDLYNKRRPGAPNSSKFSRKDQYKNASKNLKQRKINEGLLDRRLWLQPVTDMALMILKKSGSYPDKGSVADAILAGKISSSEIELAVKAAETKLLAIKYKTVETVEIN